MNQNFNRETKPKPTADNLSARPKNHPRRFVHIVICTLISCESGKASAPHKMEKSGAENLNPKKIKKIAILVAVALMALITPTQAQKTFKASDVYNGKTVKQTAKEYDLNAFLETKTIYKSGMTESAFVDICLQAFPANFKSLRDAYVPYAKYLYSFHERGLDEKQVVTEINGEEFADCATAVLAWQKANPGVQPTTFSWWRKAIHWAAVFFTWLDGVLAD